MGKTLAFSLILASLLIFNACKPPEPPAEPGLGDAIIFSLPASMTGSAETRGGETRAISAGAATTINSFFKGVRDQVLFADDVSWLVRGWINRLEAAGVFGLESTTVATISSGPDAGDVVRWTPNGGTSYTLEWWKKQSIDPAPPVHQKFVHLDFTEYAKDEAGVVTAQGIVLIDVQAYPGLSPIEGFAQNPKWVKVEFDTNNADNKQQLKIYIQGFKGININAAGPEQEAIILATKDANGLIEVSGSTSADQVGILTYANSTADLVPKNTEEWEKRYYVYRAVGIWDKATVSLGLPLNTYSNATVFDYDNAVGSVVREFIADCLRDNGDLSGDGVADGHALLSAFGLPEPFSYTDVTPSTIDIYNGISSLESEDIYTLMRIENPVYFETQSYVDFGAVVPFGWENYVTPSLGVIFQAEVDGLDLQTPVDAWIDTPPSS